MNDNANAIHGASRVTWIPTTDEHHAAMSEATLRDPQYEIVYVAEEHFEDGYASLNICWRCSDPTFKPKFKGEKAQPKTYLSRVVWWTTKGS
jgi:hypothetical protein